jgi:hypothetical protein
MTKTIQAVFWVAAGTAGRGKISHLRILELP